MPIRRGATGFIASRNGFKFGNSFTLRPSLFKIDFGSWGMGLCGGMCFSALDRYFRANPPPPDTTPPKDGTPLFEELFQRQMENLFLPLYAWGGPPNTFEKTIDWQWRPDEGHSLLKHSVGFLTKEEWRDVRRSLERGVNSFLWPLG
jgi:hypothetical protein